MAQPVTVTVNGSVSAQPSATNALAPSLAATVLFGTQRTYSYRVDDSFSINSPVSPTSVNLGSITNVRFIFLRTIGSPVTAFLTSPAGSAQAFPVSEYFLWSSPSVGSQVTAISLQGVSDLEMILVGD